MSLNSTQECTSAQEYHHTTGVPVGSTLMPNKPSGCWIAGMLCAGLGIFSLVAFFIIFTASVGLGEGSDGSHDDLDGLLPTLSMFGIIIGTSACLVIASIAAIMGCSSVPQRTCLLSLAVFAAALCTGMLVALVIYLARRSHHDSHWEEMMRGLWILDGSFCGLVLLVLFVWSVLRWYFADLSDNRNIVSVDTEALIV